MSNYLSLNEAQELANIDEGVFLNKYVNGGILSVTIVDDERKVELSEFFRVFPHARKEKKVISSENSELELQLSQMKVENLEYKIASLERQLEKQTDEHNWLRSKFDNTTMLLEQKLDTSEVDKYKQEIHHLSHQAIQWEKKYNTLLAANELKTLLRENRELKEQISAKPQAPVVPEHKQPEQDQLKVEVEHFKSLKAEIAALQQALLAQQAVTITDKNSPVDEVSQITPKRRKIFGIF